MAVKNMAASVLREAIDKTLKHRSREYNPNAFEEIQDFEKNVFLNTQWKAFEPAKNAGLEFTEALGRLDSFLKPIYESILEDTEWTASWNSKEQKWYI